jgi:hypothetical protein
MVPTIRVDEDVYEALGRRAIPFVDKTPNDVLRRLLSLVSEPIGQPDVQGSQGLKRPKPRVPDATPKQVYRRPILRLLSEAGGQRPLNDVLNEIEKGFPFLPGDLEPITTGEIRWRNRAKWARKDMALEGLIKSDSPRGVWEITDLGREHLAKGLE